MEVIDIEDHGVVPLPPTAGNYAAKFMFDPNNRPAFTEFRDDLKPLEITQPDGPSFTVDGNQVQWQKWSLRIGFNPREGLVLHQVALRRTAARLRPILHRASLSEMVVPYGDPAPTHWNKNAFDAGEYGLGLLGQLARRSAATASARSTTSTRTVNDADGKPLHDPERDLHARGGLRHPLEAHRPPHRRRSRCAARGGSSSRFIATVGNYEYGFFWYLYHDGTIQLEVKLTGILSPGAIADGRAAAATATLVAPGLYAPNHQHFFNVRLDFDVDGAANRSTRSTSSRAEPGPDNPSATRSPEDDAAGAGEPRRTRLIDPLRRPAPGRSSTRTQTTRSASRSATSWCPGTTCCRWRRRARSVCDAGAGSSTQHLWVTPYDAGARSTPPASTRTSSRRRRRPAARTAADRPLENTDVVLWYTLRATTSSGRRTGR